MRRPRIRANKPLGMSDQFCRLTKAQLACKNDGIRTIRNYRLNRLHFSNIPAAGQNNLQTSTVQATNKRAPIVRSPSLVGKTRHGVHHDVRHVKTSLSGQLRMRLRHIRCLCGLGSCCRKKRIKLNDLRSRNFLHMLRKKHLFPPVALAEPRRKTDALLSHEKAVKPRSSTCLRYKRQIIIIPMGNHPAELLPFTGALRHSQNLIDCFNAFEHPCNAVKHKIRDVCIRPKLTDAYGQ